MSEGDGKGGEEKEREKKRNEAHTKKAEGKLLMKIFSLIFLYHLGWWLLGESEP